MASVSTTFSAVGRFWTGSVGQSRHANLRYTTRVARPKVINPNLPTSAGQRVTVTVSVTAGDTNEPDPTFGRNVLLRPETAGPGDVLVNACAKLILYSRPSNVPSSGQPSSVLVQSSVFDCFYFLEARMTAGGDYSLPIWQKIFQLTEGLDLP